MTTRKEIFFMTKIQSMPTVRDLYKAGSHFGHLKSRSDARADEYVFTHRNKVAVIDLDRTIQALEKALEFVKEQAARGAQFLFVGTKAQARDTIKQTAEVLGQPYIIERWPGGLISNYDVVVKSIKKMLATEKNLAEGKLEHLKKKERLKIEKDLAKTRRIFGGLEKLSRKPDVLVLVDVKEESNAVAEAKQAGIEVVALCDTTSNPREVKYPIVANDDSIATIKLILGLIGDAVKANYKAPVVKEAEEKVDARVEKALEKPVRAPSTKSAAKPPVAPRRHSERSEETALASSSTLEVLAHAGKGKNDAR